MDPGIRQGLRVSFLIVAALMAAALGASSALNACDPQLAFVSRLAPHFGYVPGHHCALCGMTHSFVACSRGDLHAASVANPLGPLTYFCFLLAAAVGFVMMLRDGMMCMQRSRRERSS